MEINTLTKNYSECFIIENTENKDEEKQITGKRSWINNENNKKSYHLTESKTFCMSPWIHVYSSPSGVAAPCCIAESCAHEGVGNTRTQSLMEVVNSPKMNTPLNPGLQWLLKQYASCSKINGVNISLILASTLETSYVD